MARKTKEFEQYLTGATSSHVSHKEYLRAPAVAFLKFTIESKNSINHCIRHFPKKNDGTYTKDSIDSLHYLVLATLPTLMGHFETYQRYLFAGMFDMSVLLKSFNTQQFFKSLSEQTNITLDWQRLAAHRGIGATSIGTVLADSMSGWHDPKRVNSYFAAFKLNYNAYGNTEQEKLLTLWQLRHSIVHTGGTLSLADAQKVKSLRKHGGSQIVFEQNFTFEVARKMHPIVQKTTEGLGEAYKRKLRDDLTNDQIKLVDDFFEVKSSTPSWLQKA
ncbi:HEPN domain-containing protein [Vibrio alginolyticus]|uniref:HEPN domain-containing protein n=1 Tax=Vibrio alginolyticus TaxID=663 RepID=UPI001EEB7603|nr:HEPN domain-containing protein [Vibrio alginolyticus]